MSAPTTSKPVTKPEKSGITKPRKIGIYIRLDADIVERFKASGKGWQTRMNEALKAAKA